MSSKKLKLPGREITVEEFSKLPYQEQYDLLKQSFESISNSSMRGVLFDAKSKRMCSISEVLGTGREKEFIDAIIESINKGTATASIVDLNNPDNNVDEDAKKLMNLLDEQAKESMMVVGNVSKIISEVARFTEKERKYHSTLADYIAALMSIFTLHAIMDENCILNNYRNDPEAGSQVIGALADDIFNTWQANISSKPDNTILALALMQKALELTENIALTHVDEIVDVIHEAAEEEGEDGSVQVRIRNGSNTEDKPKSNVIHPRIFNGSNNGSNNDEDEDEMRDLLRD